jgi:hypothetical protein
LIIRHGSGLYRDEFFNFATNNEWRRQATKNNDETQWIIIK